MVYLTGWIQSPYYGCPLLDEQYHDEWARDIAHGAPVEPKPFFRAPLYPYFLATIYRWLGEEPIQPRIAQALLGSLSAVLAFFLGRRLFGLRVGATAGLLTAAYPVLIFYDGELLLPVLLVFLDLAFALALTRAWGEPLPRRWLPAGALGGLSAITRPNILLPMLAFGLWKAWRWRGPQIRRRGIVSLCAYAAGAALAIAPVAIRNRVVAGDWVLIASQGGIVLYAGNGPEADGFVPRTPVIYSRFGRYEDTFEVFARREAERQTGRPMPPSEVSQYWTRRTLDHIASHPARWLGLMATKAAGFWTRVEVRNNKNVDYALQFSPPIHALRKALNFAWIGPLALAGMFWAWRVAPQARPLSALALMYAATFLPFFNCDRYRLPMVPLSIVMASWALWRLAGLAGQRRWKSLAPPLAILIPAFALVNVDWFHLDPQPTAEDEWMVSVCYEQKGDTEAARKALERAIAQDPRHAAALHSLGNIASRQKDYAAAERWFLKSIEADPTYATAYNSLGALLALKGRGEEARQALEQCLSIDPFHVLARVNLGNLLQGEGKGDEAEAQFRKAVERKPKLAAPWLALARMALKRGDKEEARRSVEEALNSGDPAANEAVEADVVLRDLLREIISSLVED